MQLRQMLWAPRRVPVCVFERISRSLLIPDLRLVFLGRMAVSPTLFIGAAGYFAYLADRDRFRSVVLSDLKRIMSFASLDSTYRVENWFVKKGRLCVHVAKRSQGTRRRLDWPSKGFRSWLGRELPGL
jgi:hypothetical protein